MSNTISSISSFILSKSSTFIFSKKDYMISECYFEATLPTI